MRRFVPIVAITAAAFGVAACSPGTSDFANDAEDFINEDDGDVETELGVALDDANCAEPDSKDVGSTFTCTAVDADGTTQNFVATITGESSYTISGADGPTPTGSTPASTTG